MSENKKKSQKKKFKIWPWVMTGFVLILAILLFVVPARKTGPGYSIREAKLEKSNITVTVVGTGHLDYDETTDIEVPEGILVDRVFVEACDRVDKGSQLARFDPLSVQLAIDRVLGDIESYDLAIQKALPFDDTEVMRARVAGRVKAIYVEEGDRVSDVYEELGAVMLVSLDGKMAVSVVCSDEMHTGDKVNVVLSDGAVKEGTVKGLDGKMCTVTVTDNGPDHGEKVTVETKDGDVIGTGALFVNKPLAIIGLEGKVKTVHVANNEKFVVGKALLTLEDLQVGSAYEKLIEDREKSKEQLSDLLTLQKTHMLLASSDAFILGTTLQEGEMTGNATTDMGTGSLTGQLSPGTQKQADSSAAFTVAPVNMFTLMINIDELDILTVKKGQKAEISFDAIKGKTFTGTVESVAVKAIEAGGIAKYPARILVAADDSMRVGMSVTAKVTVDEKTDILLIPVAALQESVGQVFVYTEKNEKTDVLEGKRDVTTGLSDGDRVEITEGLDEGVTVYYRVASADNMFPFGPPGMMPGRNTQQTSGNNDG